MRERTLQIFAEFSLRNTWIHRCAHTEIQIVGNIYPRYGWVTELSHGGARIRDVKIRGRRTNLNHTRPHTQSRWGEATKLRYSGARILYIKIRGRRTNLAFSEILDYFRLGHTLCHSGVKTLNYFCETLGDFRLGDTLCHSGVK